MVTEISQEHYFTYADQGGCVELALGSEKGRNDFIEELRENVAVAIEGCKLLGISLEELR